MIRNWIRRFLWWVQHGDRPYNTTRVTWYERPRQDKKIGEL